jgi:mevalonate kinase
MMMDTIEQMIDQYKNTALGWKVSGAGGGGYLILVSETPIENALRIYIRRENS